MAPNGDENTPSTDDNISLTQVKPVDFTPCINQYTVACVLCKLYSLFIVVLCQPSVVTRKFQISPVAILLFC